MTLNPQDERDCRCDELACSRVVDCAPVEEDELRLPRLQTVAHAGDHFWWLSYRRCPTCGRHWMVAQEERINDVCVVREMSATEAADILQLGSWPDDFKQYETLLRLGQEAGHRVRFVDPRCNTLVRTASDLVAHRPVIEDREIAELLNVSLDDAAWLRQAAHEGT